MLYFLFGPDTYRSREKLKELTQKYQNGFEMQKIEGKNIKLGEFRSRIMSASLLSTQRLFVIENLSHNKEQKEITQFLREDNISSNDILLFYEEEVNKQSSLFRFLAGNPPKGGKNERQTSSKEGGNERQIFAFEFLKGAELKKWVKNYVRESPAGPGGKIEEVALEELLMSGNDLWLLSRELDKLLSYHKHITLENVKLLTPVSFDDNIFNLTDAIGLGDKAKALELLNQQLVSGTEPIYLLTMIIRQFRILIEVKEAAEKERFPNYNFIAQGLSLHPFVVQKCLAQSQKYSFEELEKAYQSLQVVDIKLKTSKLSAGTLLTSFILKH